MALGPFVTYVPPGVYTRTLTEANAANLVAGLRIPVYIGVGQEELDQSDLELVRGSSSNLDQQILNEDVSQRFVVSEVNPNNIILGAADGALAKFRVRNIPIVDGQGFGRVSNNIRTVSVTVNGEPQSVGSVQGADGFVTLQVPPPAGADIRCTYFFHRSDTAFLDDVSDQITAGTAELTTPAIAPFVVTAATTDTFVLRVDSLDRTIVLAAGSYTAAALKSAIDAALISGLATSVFTDNEGNDHLRFFAARSLVVGAGNANGALGFAPNTASTRNATFRVFQRPIVDGTDGGITTTDPTKVTAVVDGTQVVVTAVDGTNGLVTLPFAPADGSTVTLQYFANTWQDTFDYLPNTLVTQVVRAGFSPGRSDFIEQQDFVVSNPSPDVSIIHWGASYVVASTLRSPGAALFDDTQVLPSLVDDRLYMSETTRVVDTTVVPAVVSNTQFELSEVPTTGNGRDTVLGSDVFTAVTNNKIGLNTNRPDLVQAWAGTSVDDALSRNALTVTTVDATTRVVTVKETVPPDHTLFATFFYSRLRDDTYILTNKVSGAVGTGQFEVLSTATNASVYQVRFGVKAGLPEIVQWPRGVEQIPDAFHTGAGDPVSETVTVTFGSSAAANAKFTNTGEAPYNFYATSSTTWRTDLNAGGTLATPLAAATRGFLVGDRVAVDGADSITIVAGVNDTLNLEIDGALTPVTVTLTPGVTLYGPAASAGSIADQINDAIDLVDTSGTGGIDLTATAPNGLCEAYQMGGATSDVVFVIESYSTPAALPGGFDHSSTIEVRQGNAETTLGFAAFQSASGSPQSLNKPATLLGTEASTFNIVTGTNDELKIRIDGIDYTITLTAGATVAVATLVTDINTAVGSTVASAGTLANAGLLRLFSTTNNAGSTLVILDGSANATLGFIQGDSANNQSVEAQEVVNSLLTTAGFLADGIAYVSTINGSDYVTIESRTTGAATSSVAFVAGTGSAFNETTGTEIVAGTSGDNGEDAQDNYVVSSNQALGSAGTGVPGQTYTDERTGLRFTVLPSAVAGYTGTGTFELAVSPTWNVSPAIPYLSLGGMEVLVTDTVGIGIDDTATVQTFNPGGLEPATGDFYFISYKFLKQDFTTRLFQQFKTIEANFGALSAENRVTLAAFLAILNGAVLVGIKQVLKVVNTNQASDQTFIDAIAELATPLPGNVRPDIICPLATSTAIYQFLMQHVETQSNIRNQGERMGFIGFPSGTTPTVAQTIAKSLLSNRIVACYPDSAVVTLTNELGESFESLVDGTFLAAAVAGAVVSPAVDVATPYTRRQVLGFTRLQRQLDPVEANQTAVAGITLLEDLDPIIRIRQGLTTDMTTILTRLPTVVQIADSVHQSSRSVLDGYVGTKFLATRTNEVEVTMTALFKQLVQAEIVGAFTGIAAEVDPDDPTILRFEAFYQPIFPLLYLVLTFNLRARI